MRQLNKSILHLELPERMHGLPIDDRGFPVPKFVPWVDGRPEFRAFDPEHMINCIRHKRCWLCGSQLGKFVTFPIGPMCLVGRTISEPPSHLTCAEYGVRACPFLVNPNARRNEKNLPEDGQYVGEPILRNPGVIALYTTTTWKPFKPPGGGVLFHIGEKPEHLEFYREGRRATREEIMHSIESGLPTLREGYERQGISAQFQSDYDAAMKLVPAT